MAIDNTVLVAVVGVASATVTGLLTNWDKIFNRNKTVTAAVTGYQASGNLREEIGILLERTGARETFEDMETRILAEQEKQLKQMLIDEGSLEDLPDHQRILDIFREELPDYDDFRKLIVPIYEKYYTISIVEELNKIQSTQVMRDLRAKSKSITDEYWPLWQEVNAKSIARAQARIEIELASLDDDSSLDEEPDLPVKR